MYLDFAKAFDKVPHKKLLLKLKSKGIVGKLHEWIKHCLKGRQQKIVPNGLGSSWEEVLSGVPQGSILGPILFLIYKDEIDAETVNLKVTRIFADDTKAAGYVRNMEEGELFQECLNNLCGLAITWGIEFNTKKCKIMHIGRNNSEISYNMNGVQLQVVWEETDLEVRISNNLKMSKQCSQAAGRARFVLGQISRTFHCRDRYVFMNLYKRYVWPHLEFPVPAWCPSIEQDKEIIEKVQMKGLRSEKH